MGCGCGCDCDCGCGMVMDAGQWNGRAGRSAASAAPCPVERNRAGAASATSGVVIAASSSRMNGNGAADDACPTGKRSAFRRGRHRLQIGALRALPETLAAPAGRDRSAETIDNTIMRPSTCCRCKELAGRGARPVTWPRFRRAACRGARGSPPDVVRCLARRTTSGASDDRMRMHGPRRERAGDAAMQDQAVPGRHDGAVRRDHRLGPG